MDKKISALSKSGFLTGTEAVPIVQGGVTVQTSVQDIANLAPSLEFFWNKENDVFSSRIVGPYKPLGIKFKNLTLEPGVTYTLLIDRWKRTELKDNTVDPIVFRGAGFYHEVDASLNGRQNEIQITSTIQMFDFNPDFYFRAYTVPSSFPIATGMGGRGQSYTKFSQTIKLGFRIRIDHPTKGIQETPILGSILMLGQRNADDTSRTISYMNI